MGDAIARDLQGIIYTDNFGAELFKSAAKRANDRKENAQRNKKKVILEINFQECTLQSIVGHFTGLVALYKQGVINVSREQFLFSSPEKRDVPFST